MINKGLTPDLMALRAVKELKAGDFVNLGIGLPVLVSNFITKDMRITLLAENGVLGYGEIVYEGAIEPECLDAGKNAVKMLPGISFFDSAEAFSMIRGGHVDVTVLGGLQVSENGDLANWLIKEGASGTLGGAMDLTVGAKKVIVLMRHTTKEGTPRIVKKCSYPLTAKGEVNIVITDLAVIEATPEGLLLKEIAPQVGIEEIQSLTEPRLLISPNLKEMEL